MSDPYNGGRPGLSPEFRRALAWLAVVFVVAFVLVLLIL